MIDLNINLKKSSINGTVPAISSKSAVHRALICAALSDSPTELEFRNDSDDVCATLQCISALGCTLSPTERGIVVTPPSSFQHEPHFDCLECGSTLRFMLPVAAALFESFSMSGSGGLVSRPLEELMQSMKAQGCSFLGSALPFSAKGRLKPGDYIIPGNVSSQYISGLLFALPLLDGESRIVLTSPLSSCAYVEMTLQMLRAFGIEIEVRDSGYIIKGSQKYKSPGRIALEGDWSAAATWLCAGAISGPVTVTGLNLKSQQADIAILEILEKVGAKVVLGENSVTVSRGALRPVSISIDQCPDLMPVVSMLLANCDGRSLIYDAARLRIKESDRITTMSDALSALGIRTEQERDSLSIFGGKAACGTIHSANDHRIVMAAAVASAVTELTLMGSDAASKSYPSFFEDYRLLGGVTEII